MKHVGVAVAVVVYTQLAIFLILMKVSPSGRPSGFVVAAGFFSMQDAFTQSIVVRVSPGGPPLLVRIFSGLGWRIPLLTQFELVGVPLSMLSPPPSLPLGGRTLLVGRSV